MNTSFKVLGVGLLISALIIPAVALAAEVRVGESPSFPSSETVQGDMYIAGGTITSAGKVNGDLIVGGGNVIVNGAVSQDLAAGGGSITIISDIGDDARVAGGTIILSGKVAGDLVIAAGQTTVLGAGIGGDVVWGGGMLSIDAPVAGNMLLGGGEVVINSRVRGNVEFKGGKLTLGKNAVIEGNLTYSAQAQATLEEGAVVGGETVFTPQATPASKISMKGILAFLTLVVLGKFLSALIFALALGLFFKRYTTTLVHNATAQPLLEIGRGIIVLIVLPIASIIFLVTLIGIPFGVLGIIGFIGLLMFASPIAAIITGSVVHKWFSKSAEYHITWQTILLGVAVYTLIGFVPFLGGIAKFALVLLALGAMLKMKWQVIQEWR